MYCLRIRLLRYLVPALMALSLAAAQEPVSAPQYQSPFLRVELEPDQPAFAALAVDSLGKNKLSLSPLRHPGAPRTKYELRRDGFKFEYRAAGAPAGAPAAWTFEFSAKQIRLHSSFSPGNPPPPLVLNFNSFDDHPTLLGLMNDDGSVRLPALLHLPDHGTFRITSSQGNGLALGYDAQRFFTWDNNLNYQEGDQAYVKVTIPPATASLPQLDYTFDVVAIYPPVPGIERDPRFDGFRRNWLNIFQLSPRRGRTVDDAVPRGGRRCDRSGGVRGRRPRPPPGPQRPRRGPDRGRRPRSAWGNRPPLTGIRALALSTVLVYHSNFKTLPGAWVALQIFFVLSGFLISHAVQRGYAPRQDQPLAVLREEGGAPGAAAAAHRGGPGHLRLVRPRGRRLPASVGDSAAAMFYYADYRQAFGHAPFFGYLAQTWSLSVEEQFYIIWSILLVVTVAIHRRRLAYLLAIVGMAASIGDRLWQVYSVAHFYTPKNVAFTRVYYAFDTRADALFLGCLLGLLATDGYLQHWEPWAVGHSPWPPSPGPRCWSGRCWRPRCSGRTWWCGGCPSRRWPRPSSSPIS